MLLFVVLLLFWSKVKSGEGETEGEDEGEDESEGEDEGEREVEGEGEEEREGEGGALHPGDFIASIANSRCKVPFMHVPSRNLFFS